MQQRDKETGPAYATHGPCNTAADNSIIPLLWQAAEDYHAHGLGVIPLVPRDKRPAIASWRVYQGRRPDVSERWSWFGEHPTHNIGIVCGRVSGGRDGFSLVVLDFDSEEKFETFRKEHQDLVSRTWVAKTGRGNHVYLRVRGIVHTTKFDGGDIKGEGTYVVAPPSIHPTGVQYHWINKPPEIAEVPDLGTLTQRKTPPQADSLTPAIFEGERNTTLFYYALFLHRQRQPKEEIQAALEELNRQRCQPPLPDKEIAQIVKSATSYPRTYPLTDLGNAERLAAQHGNYLRYCHPWAQWFFWDGRRWTPDTRGVVVARAKETVRALYAEAALAHEEHRRKRIAGWAAHCESRTKIDAMIALARSEEPIPVVPEEFDQDKFLFNVANGTINLRTGALRAHNPKDMITKITPVPYVPDAKAPTWLAFLNRIMDGNQDLIAFLRRAVGYSLTGDVSERVLFFLYGCGANGKSTFLETIRAMAGEYALRTPTETLLARRSDVVPNDIARLRGARLVTAAESEEGRRLAEALVKDLTGGDTVAARFLHREYFEFRPTGKIWLATNHKPVVRGTDRAIWDRIRLVPFSVVIPEEEQDKHMIDKLKAELPGILAWAVKGCLEWQEKGLGVPPEVREATERYRDAMDVLGAFLNDYCELDPLFTVTTKDLYQAYTGWCLANGETPIGKSAFSMRMEERGFHHFRTGKTRGWVGLRLKEWR